MKTAPQPWVEFVEWGKRLILLARWLGMKVHLRESQMEIESEMALEKVQSLVHLVEQY